MGVIPLTAARQFGSLIASRRRPMRTDNPWFLSTSSTRHRYLRSRDTEQDAFAVE
jgi:hypothetical protein